MKAIQLVLIFALLASFNSDLISFIMCFVGNSSVLDICNTLYQKIKDGEAALNIIMYLVSNINTLYEAVKNCNL